MKPRTRKVFRWVGIVFGGLLLLFALFLIEEHVRGRIELNRYIEQMRARGEKFTIAELTPAPAPPNENGAGLLMGVGFPQNGIVPNQIPPSMRYVTAGVAIPGISFPAWSLTGPYEVRLATNVFAIVANTNGPARTGRGPGPGIPSASPRAARIVTVREVAEEIAANSNGLAQVRAALAYAELDYGLDYSQGFSVPFSHLPREKSASQWLRAASFSALQETNLNAALDNLVGLAALSHATTNQALMIGQLVRIAILQITVAATWEALQADGWNDARLAKLQAALTPNDFVSAMTRTFEMERAMGAMMIDGAAMDSTQIRDFLETDMEWSPPSLPENAEEAMEPLRNMVKNGTAAFNRFIYYPIWKFAWKDQDKLHCMRYWQALIDIGRTQADGSIWPINKPQMHESDEASFSSFYNALLPPRSGSQYDRIRFLLSSLLVGVGHKGLEKALTAEAAQQLAAIAIAIRRFQIASGKVPASLDDLVPKFLPAVPLDPFDGKPLRYKRNDDGSFTLYSVGLNRKDDGGDASPQANGGRPNFQNMRDLVWPRAATPEETQKFIEAEAGHSRSSTAP